MSRGDHEWVQCDPRSWKTCDEGRMEMRVRWIHGWVTDGSCMSWMGNGRVVGGSIDGPWVGQTRVRGGGKGRSRRCPAEKVSSIGEELATGVTRAFQLSAKGGDWVANKMARGSNLEAKEWVKNGREVSKKLTNS